MDRRQRFDPRHVLIVAAALGLAVVACGPVTTGPSAAAPPASSQLASEPTSAASLPSSSELPSPTTCVASDPLECLMAAVDAIAASDGFSGQIAVTRDGATVWEGIYGLDPSGDPMTATTRLELASAAKMFTGVSIGQLVESGRIKLDDTIGTYVDDLPADVASSRLSSLLSHTAGLSMNDWRSGLVYPPGEFHYSNAGFGLLDLVVEAASGQSLVAYERQNIFEPAGMANTRFDEPGTTTTESDGSTASDMVRFANALIADKLVGDPMRRELTSLKVKTDFGGYAYGFAIFTGTAGEAPSIGHIGAAPQIVAAVEISEPIAYTIVVLCRYGFEAIAPALVEYQKQIRMGYWRG
jgi:CubicO group peptidase (beta-lactamase class C family)